MVSASKKFKEEPANLVFARELARSYKNLATIFEETGRFVEARDLLRTGVRINEEVLAKAPDDRQAERDLAATLHSFEILLHRTGEPDEAEKAWRRGIALLEKAVARSPDESSPRERLGMTYHSLGMVLEDARRLGEAETALEQALTHKRRLVKDFPNNFDYAKQLANTCNSLGILARKKSDSAEAELYFREALAMHERLQQDRPDSFDLSLALVGSYCNIGIALSDQAKVKDALPWLDKAADRLEKLRQANPRHPSTRQYTRNTHQARARVLCALGRFRDAVSDWDRAIEYDPGPFRSVYRVYRTLTLAHLGEFEKALPEARELVNQKHVEAGAYFELACVFALAAATKTADAEEHAQQAVALLMQARDGGYRYRPRFERDPDLDALRGRADFQQVLKGLAAR